MKPSLRMRTASLGGMMETQHVTTASDQIMAMKRQEENSTLLYKDYFDMEEGSNHVLSSSEPPETSSSCHNVAVDQETRMKISEWFYQVADFFKLNRETVGIAMSYLDRFLSTPSAEARLYITSKRHYQLAAITSLHMAVKIHEPVEMDPSLLLELGRGCYTWNQILETESTMLRALDWRMHAPTPVAFVQNMLVFLPSTVHASTRNKLSEIARYQTEIAVLNYPLASMKASSIAAAAILNAMDALDRHCFSSGARAEFLHHLAKNFGIDRQMDGVGQCRRRLVSQLTEMDHVPDIRRTRVTRKSRVFLLQRSRGSRSLSSSSPVSVSVGVGAGVGVGAT